MPCYDPGTYDNWHPVDSEEAKKFREEFKSLRSDLNQIHTTQKFLMKREIDRDPRLAAMVCGLMDALARGGLTNRVAALLDETKSGVPFATISEWWNYHNMFE